MENVGRWEEWRWYEGIWKSCKYFHLFWAECSSISLSLSFANIPKGHFITRVTLKGLYSSWWKGNNDMDIQWRNFKVSSLTKANSIILSSITLLNLKLEMLHNLSMIPSLTSLCFVDKMMENVSLQERFATCYTTRANYQVMPKSTSRPICIDSHLRFFFMLFSGCWWFFNLIFPPQNSWLIWFHVERQAPEKLY